jgi:MYXO-CTERM domain-containing protein
MIKTALAATALAAFSFSAQAVTVVQWDFESYTAPTGTFTTFGGIAPSIGTGLGSVFHSTAATFSTPVGNGSAKSLSANNWSVNDYWQFTFSTVGYSGVTVTFDQAGSGSGPRDFTALYSLDAVNFSPLGSYAVALSSWSSAAPATGFDHTFSLPVAASDAPTVYFMIRDVATVSINGSTIGTGGTNRVDNFTVSATPVPEADTAAMLVAGLAALGFMARRRRG